MLARVLDQVAYQQHLQVLFTTIVYTVLYNNQLYCDYNHVLYMYCKVSALRDSMVLIIPPDWQWACKPMMIRGKLEAM
jgi:hypothetical protein